MIVTRINGRYSIEAKNVAPEDLISDLESLVKMIRMDMDSSDDCLFVTGIEDNNKNKGSRLTHTH